MNRCCLELLGAWYAPCRYQGISYRFSDKPQGWPRLFMVWPGCHQGRYDKLRVLF